MEPIFEFDTVSYTWPGGKGLQNVCFSVPAGAFVMITGTSGAGKSTLLRLAVRLEEPSSGSVRFAGIPLEAYAPPQLRQRIGYIQQTPVVVDGSVRENLLLGFGFSANVEHPVPDDSLLSAWLQRLALDGVQLDDSALRLSVGQRQRVCIIRSLLLNPEVLLMDEPTSALDRESRDIVEQVTEVVNREGMTICMVAHSGYRPACGHMQLVVRNGQVEVVG